MNQWQNIQNSFRNWRREQVLWAVVVILGLVALIVFLLRPEKGTALSPAPSENIETGEFVPTFSATPSPSELPTFEELPFELTQSDIDINEPTDEAFGPTEEDEIESTPTFYVRPFSSNTPTRVPTARGGGGYFLASSTPNSIWTQYARTSTALAKTNTVRAARTNTALAPTRQSATAAVQQTRTSVANMTSMARTPRPEQIVFFEGTELKEISATAASTPVSLAITSATVVAFGDWAPNGQKIVLVLSSELGENDLYLHDVNIKEGSLVSNPYILDNQPEGNNSQPAWSPNGSWIVFVNGTPGEDGSSLYRIHWDGNKKYLQQLTRSIPVAMPDWSPASNKLVFVSNGQLYTIDVNPLPLATPLASTGGQVVAALHPPALNLFVKLIDFSWLFQTPGAETATPPGETTAIPAASSEPALTPSPAATTRPDIETPAAAEANSAGVLAATSTFTPTPKPTPAPTQISPEMDAAWPHFSPDGKSILFQCGNDICLYEINSYNVQKVAESSGDMTYSYPFWSRSSNRFGYVAKNSKAGTYTIFLQTNILAEPLYTSTSEIRNPAWRP